MNIIFENNVKNVYTPISNIFINKYMPYANSVFVCIYIYSLNKCLNEENISFKNIAKTFNILESDVFNAFKYWDEKKIIEFNQDDDNIIIKFLEINDDYKDENIYKDENAVANNDEKKLLLTSRPTYTSEEFEIYQKQSPDAKRLFSLSQKILGRMLSFNDMSTVYGFYDWLGMSIELIEKLLNFCVNNGHRNMKYIETVAIDWDEHEIKTIKDADEYIDLFNNEYKSIMDTLGNKGTPTKAQQDFMEKWIKKFNFSIDIIQKACEKTVLSIGKPDFIYVDKKLTDWFNKNVKSLEEAEEAEAQFNAAKKENSKNTGNSKDKYYNNKPSKFVNYEQRCWDFDKLNKLKNELLDKKLKG